MQPADWRDTIPGEDFMPGVLRIFLATAVYGALHSFLAAPWAKNAFQRRFGSYACRFYRLGYNAAAVITLIPLLAVVARNLGPILLIVPWPWAAVPGAAQLVSLALLWVSFRQSDPAGFLGLSQLGGVGGGDTRLNIRGAYAWMRHPMYSFGLLVLWCVPIVTAGTLALDIGLTLYIVVGSELEERRLLAQFGEEYARYRSRVARLIPFIF
jgi:protein-S-isoprenylcysteine O-methyltransferase Ste14